MIPAYSEADTRSKLIDPALRRRGWTETHIRRKENAGGLYRVGGRWRRENKFVDYVLRLPIADRAEPVALIEAKRNTLPADHGLEQAKQYAAARRLNVPFVYSSNGYRFVEFDAATGQTSPAYLLSQFPTPEELRQRYEAYVGFGLDDEKAKPLLAPYTGGNSVRRYYQDAAIRAALEKIAQGGKRMLLALATGSGKTRQEARELGRRAQALENAVYDLKAVNPSIQIEEDSRSPEELMALIEAKGREVAETLALLRGQKSQFPARLPQASAPPARPSAGGHHRLWLRL